MSALVIPGLIKDEHPDDIEALPELFPGFFVPRLADKPQNPIMDTLKRREDLNNSSTTIHSLPTELRTLTLAAIGGSLVQADPLNDNIWEQSVKHERPNLSHILSWDSLRHSNGLCVLPSPFLSQQTSRSFAFARYHVRTPLQDPSSQLVYTSIQDLSEALRLSLTGSSSSVHVWDPTSETFVLREVKNGKNGIVVIIGKDEIVSASIIRRFLTIGTLTRRLENFVSRYRASKPGPTTNAFIHALSAVLSYHHPILATAPAHLQHPTVGSFDDDDMAPITAAWAYYAQIEEVLQALATLCNRDEDAVPTDYKDFPTNPADILSLIFQHLTNLMERHMQKEVIAIFAYLLTMTSRHYIQELCRSVGYRTIHSRLLPPLRITAELAGGDIFSSGQYGDIPDDAADEPFESDMDGAFPKFIEADVGESLLRARRSLSLLRVAQPNHSLLSGDVIHPDIEWFWTRREVEAAWNEQTLPAGHLQLPSSTDPYGDNGGYVAQNYPEGMEAFSIFDLKPGGHIAPTSESPLLLDLSSVAALRAFLESFPSSLPSLTPTLPHLTSLVLLPLTGHIDSLSSTLVSLYLSPSTPLHFAGHLVLLRSYLLLTSHTFKSRLGRALFSDADEPEQHQQGTFLHNTGPTRLGHDKAGKSSTRWPVGLSSALTEEGTWPPAGASLSFYLRTVIIDSLESCHDEIFRDGSDSHGFIVIPGEDRIVEEAAWRLGFSLRDLPAGTGREKWLDPLSIESLDFLYMDYKPPKALAILITHEILSKYHRIFAFNLRLMRVESAIQAVYRMSSNPREPLFPNFTRINTLLLHFRYVAHSFVTSLISYVFDTAVGGNFDAFLSKLASQGRGSVPAFPDVFSLADYHSRMLDTILSACLLRSGQRKVGDLLRECLELVLDFATLAGDVKLGRVEEYEASPVLEDLWDRFRSRMVTLVQVLKALVEKGYGSSRVLAEDVRLQGSPLFQVEGVTGNLRDLLVRLDVAEWWTRAYERRRQRSREATASQHR